MSNYYYSEKKYDGPEAFVVSMDIGTIHSAVSLVHFTPGIFPEAQTVAHWPGVTRWAGDAKIPTIVSYRDGVVKACGAEALLDFKECQRDVAYWFKLHLHPPLLSEPNSSEIPPLPEGTTIERVYADMMAYLMGHTKRYFEKTTPQGAEIWARVRDTIVIVLATPNAWDIRQQATLRKAAVMASLVTDDNASELLQFVTEVEASVQYVLANKAGTWLKPRTLFAVMDCGGSTIDTALYRCISTSPLSLNEACPSECVQTGGIFVDREIEKILKQKLKGSSFSNPATIKAMVEAFERDVKPKFDGVIDEYNLKFGFGENDPSFGIRNGWITLSNTDLKPAFDAVIDKIATRSSVIFRREVQYVLIVGGFGESQYLQKVLSERLANTVVVLAGDSAKKAVAEGATLGHIKQFVVARAARATFGGCVRELYNRRMHREREHAVERCADGKRRVNGAFHAWITKGTVLQGTYAQKLSYHIAWEGTSTTRTDYLKTIGIEVFAWENDGIPTWCKDEHGVVVKGMRLICTLNADLSALAGALEVQTGKKGRRFYRVDYNVCVYFGGTQLRATLQWKEKGVVREGPVTVMPEKVDILPTPTPMPDIRLATARSVEQQPEFRSSPRSSKDRRTSEASAGDTIPSTSSPVMPHYYSEKPWDGPESIVVAMDIGTTHTVVSFAHLPPGSQPWRKMVAHWPGQVHWSAAKIPSMISYRGLAPKCGAEASQDFDEDKDNVAYWFKLHVHPAPGLISNASRSQQFTIPPLPAGITIERVYADLMKYLMVHTRAFFEITTANGAEIWERVRDTIVIVLTTANAWGMREQATLRKAAIMASLVTKENAGQLLQFVNDAEASVHYALAQDRHEWLQPRTIFGIIDCGSSTVDTTIYRCVSTSPLGLTETCPSECAQVGGRFVNCEVERILKTKLEGSPFSEPEIFKRIKDAFERELKPNFDGTLDIYDFKFGYLRDNDPRLGIRKGRISLSNNELKPIFDEVVTKILNSCLNSLIKQKTQYVILVGGFAESPYMRRALSQELGKHEMQTITVGDYAKKAAAEGAIISHIKQSVLARGVKAAPDICPTTVRSVEQQPELRSFPPDSRDGRSSEAGVDDNIPSTSPPVMPNYYSEEKYEGPETIIVAMDIGTAHTVVSFAHLSPGSQPQGRMVAHWPGLVHWSGAAKIPSMVSYKDGVTKACGAEASQDFDEDKENVAYWFKLHVHPAPGLISNASRSQQFTIPPLPAGITIERVYADLMKYLMVHTRAFFEITTANGVEIWERVRDTIVIVLATPNSWGMREQATLRKAAIMASLVTEENAGQLLQFVTGAEASVHYALAQDRCEWLKPRTIFGVIDCGGSTVDTTIYRCVSTNPLGLTETCPNECVQAGSIFVDYGVEGKLKTRLEGSPFGEPEIFKIIIEALERELKPRFNGTMENYDFRFGHIDDNDPRLRIRNGRISLSNEELKPLFDDVANRILKSCLSSLIGQKAKYVILVGGFAESPYMRRALSLALATHEVQTIRVGDYAKKATAEGAIIGHIKQFVVARAVKATFGGCVRQKFDKKLHRERQHAVQVYADGKKRVDGVFHVWVTKGTVLQGTFAHKLPYHVALDATSTSKSEIRSKLGAIEIEIFAWEGDSIPIWCKDEKGAIMKGMRLLCTLNADLSSLAGALKVYTGMRGNAFCGVDYNVCVYFGGTQLRANLQ